MTRLPLYAAASALAVLAGTWSTASQAAGAFGLYTPMPQTTSNPEPYTPQTTRSSNQSDSKAFGLYTPMPVSPAGSANTARSVAKTPSPGTATDPSDPNHEPINP